eukprot:s129_g36.t1
MVEEKGVWPDNLAKGVVAFIPKDAEKVAPQPDEFRPITILSSVYRLWAEARHLQLAHFGGIRNHSEVLDEWHLQRGLLRYASCALSSHYYFWDPLAPAAPLLRYPVYMPRVMDGEVVRQCAPSFVEEIQAAFRAQDVLSCVSEAYVMWMHSSFPWFYPCVSPSVDSLHALLSNRQKYVMQEWSVSKKHFNKMMHAKFGNGGGGKGKGKGSMNMNVDPEVEYARSIKAALPEAAQIRMQPKLLQEEWNQNIKEWQHLDASGGVAVVAKENIPRVLEKVGYSSKPVGILVVQEPDEIGMMGYPRSRVKCTYDVASTGGSRKQVQVERWLVQLGFAEPVTMKAIGEEVKVGFTMTRMVAKLSVLRGWAHGPHPAGVLTQHLKKYVDEQAFDSIMARGDGSFTFLVHNVYEEVLLSKSGYNGIFLKRHSSEPESTHELLWLDEEVGLEDALAICEGAKALGVVEKGVKGRLAVRFRTEEELVAFAQANKYQYDNSVQRWKVSGVPLLAGLQGLHQMLVSLWWEVVEVVYQGEDSAVFTSTNKGKEARAL